jgi:hypothetical protein
LAARAELARAFTSHQGLTVVSVPTACFFEGSRYCNNGVFSPDTRSYLHPYRVTYIGSANPYPHECKLQISSALDTE